MPYIDAEKMRSLLEEEIEECGNPTADDNPIAYGTTLGLKMALSYTQTLQTADVAPIVHGHWIYMDTYRTVSRYKCSECERVVTQKENSCPRCFARMDEEVKE